jgi:hypothetical protein
MKKEGDDYEMYIWYGHNDSVVVMMMLLLMLLMMITLLPW